LDANLPDMTGWEVIEAARRSAVSPTSQFLMLSGTCCDEDVQQAQSLGLVGFELKPFDAEEFGRLVDRISAFAAQSVRS
ncbi:MAG: response regulator, partial [Pirellulaceae bacterium]